MTEKFNRKYNEFKRRTCSPREKDVVISKFSNGFSLSNGGYGITMLSINLVVQFYFSKIASVFFLQKRCNNGEDELPSFKERSLKEKTLGIYVNQPNDVSRVHK